MVSVFHAHAALCPVHAAGSSTYYEPLQHQQQQQQQQQHPFQARGIACAWGTSVARLMENVSRHRYPISCNASSSGEYSTSSSDSDGEDDVSSSGGRAGKARLPARMAVKAEFLQAREAEAAVEDDGPIPKITEDKVTLSFARSGGPGGQNVNKLNTKVDMRFNVLDADWLPERIRWKILEQEKNRINSDGEIVVSSTRTRTQKGNIDDALAKLQKIIDAAGYVPPPPSEEKKARIKKLAKAENERRLQDKKLKSSKKSDRRNKGSWD
ncbi:hypothetical protein CLOM_g5808 [Closterium sp. NIES-68]|nr:hypothetical protein CLOM_g5808 [Closterium sp. NIES-68]GJP73865.1 hypothetical protein CLOP_g4539 [Closterium sp. NIES-67]